jgi:hypothetical protein
MTNVPTAVTFLASARLGAIVALLRGDRPTRLQDDPIRVAFGVPSPASWTCVRKGLLQVLDLFCRRGCRGK